MVPHCQRNYILVNALKTRKQLGLFFILQADEDCCFPGFYFTHNIIQPALKPKFLFINPLKFPVAFNIENLERCKLGRMLLNFCLHLVPEYMFAQLKKKVISH